MNTQPLTSQFVSTETSEATPTLPAYQGACVSNLVPELIRKLLSGFAAPWLPAPLDGAKQIVLLRPRWPRLGATARALGPGADLTAFEGGPITTIAPTTTAAGLTSIVTGRPPSVHGIVGYRLSVENEILDVLKWRMNDADARERVIPEKFQTQPAFAANEVPAVTRRHFLGSGFTDAHMQGARVVGYSVPSSLPVEVWKLAKAGEQLVYAYYDGIDTVAHANGLGEHYGRRAVYSRPVIRDLLAGLPQGCTLVVTSDHGQVQVGRAKSEHRPRHCGDVYRIFR